MSTAPIITFDADRHAYRVNDRSVLSVTQTLKLAGLIDDRWFTPEAAQKGTYVAQATAWLDLGTLDESSLDPVLVPYCEAWRAFQVDSKVDILAIETMVCHEVHQFAGTYDRLIVLNGHETLIDIKTGPHAIWHPLQTAAYAICLPQVTQRGCVYLREDGTYRLRLHSDPNDRDVFLAALTVAQWKRNQGAIS